MPPMPPIWAEGLFSVMFRASSMESTKRRAVPFWGASTNVAPVWVSRSVPVHSTTGIFGCWLPGNLTPGSSELPWKWYSRATIDW